MRSRRPTTRTTSSGSTATWPRSAEESAAVDDQFCYLTTTGRRTGHLHTIEIWFAAAARTLYLGGSERSDWVRNLVADGSVRVRVGGEDLPATARPVERGTDEDALGRRLLLEKYQAPGSRDLENWGATALIVAIDLSG